MSIKKLTICLLTFLISIFIPNKIYLNQKIVLISVYDNYQVNKELKTGWGFSSLIKTPDEWILFDTGGNSDKLLYNMEKMKIEPDSITKVIVSHIHGDHLGGLEGFLQENNDVTVFIPHSFPKSVREMIVKQGAKFIRITESREIAPNIYTTGELPGPPPEQSLIIESKQGLVIMTGCAHPGIVKIVKKSMEVMKNKSVYLVLGGFHHPPSTIIKEFKKLEVSKVAPSHCTGDLVRNGFAKKYKENFIEYGVGKIIRIKQYEKK